LAEKPKSLLTKIQNPLILEAEKSRRRLKVKNINLRQGQKKKKEVLFSEKRQNCFW